ncbi:sugar ABC transporter substrate-binding protein [Oceanispirochaeta crateris]|uniref:Sugar ABC transporter substrate-binding protein n=1 Tax=Oceanispirochaeta crateris TaxID=2518645 RepID=A0A5C1QMD2_9SPIO|nr:sugar ABC transporter substrate-binding protein [Oceanispirochaeta crateris]QEN08369.1 sugar ABC transporter substrate-binding protein [Oceanispirochaeta crateris]
MKHFLLIVVVLLMPAFLSGKGQQEFKGRTYAATFMTLNNSFFVALNDSIKEQCEKNGDRLLSYNPDLDQVRQIDQIQDMISLGVDAIFLNPVDWKGIRPALEEATKAGIPVIVIDAAVYDSDLVISTISSDNYGAGKLIGLDLIARRESAKIAILDHPTNKPSIDRLNGFLDVLGGHPEFKVVATSSAFGSIDGAVPKMENILQTHNDISVVFCTNDPTAVGAISALEAANRKKNVLVYAIDGSPAGMAMVRNGKMMGTVAQSPLKMGKLAVEQAERYLDHQTVEKEIIIPVTLINSGNIRQFAFNSWN